MTKNRAELIDHLEIELQDYSSHIKLIEMGRAQGTERLTRFICNWARSYDLHCQREVHLGATRLLPKSGYFYKGYLDFVLSGWLAIEIDSSNKHWSLNKLEHAAQIGLAAVWIRWYSAQKFCIPQGVRLIMLQYRPYKHNPVLIA